VSALDVLPALPTAILLARAMHRRDLDRNDAFILRDRYPGKPPIALPELVRLLGVSKQRVAERSEMLG
jgi:hypothetical protein